MEKILLKYFLSSKADSDTIKLNSAETEKGPALNAYTAAITRKRLDTITRKILNDFRSFSSLYSVSASSLGSSIYFSKLSDKSKFIYYSGLTNSSGTFPPVPKKNSFIWSRKILSEAGLARSSLYSFTIILK